MASEIAEEIPEYSAACLQWNNTENVLYKKDELLKQNYTENDENCHVMDASGQIAPSLNTEANICSGSYSETEASENNAVPTVPQVSFEAMDHALEEAEHAFKPSEMNKENLLLQSLHNINCDLKNERIQTFQWPPIGFKDQLTEQTTSRKLGAFHQAVPSANEENNDDEITIIKQLPQTGTSSSSSPINHSEAMKCQENKKLTSILKKEEKQPKKKVHFPDDVVSVKFYDISDDEDSDDDTVILSDPEDDDYLIRDQEVPLNTFNHYATNYCVSSSQNFIPQFSFPPVLKITNYQLYENINDEEEQIMAIMDDDDGREQQNVLDVNDLAADEGIPGDGLSGCQHEQIMFPEVKKFSENSEEVIEIIELQTTITQRGMEELEDEPKTDKNAKETMKTGSKSLVAKEDVPSRETIEEKIVSTVMITSAPTFESDTKDATAVENTLPYTLSYENSHINEQTACDDHSSASIDDSVSLVAKQNVELQSEVKVEPALNMECDEHAKRKGNLNDSMDLTQSSSSSARIFPRNCGSTFLWRGPRTITSMMLDEDFQVSLVPAVDHDIIYRRSLENVVKEEIIFPKVGMVDVGSPGLSVLTAVGKKRAGTKHCHEEFQHTRYVIHSLISSPDHVSELEEWQTAIETEVHENQGMKPLSMTAAPKDDNKSVTLNCSKEYDTANFKEDDGHHLASQIVPDVDVKDVKTEPVKDSTRAVPSAVDDIMDTTNTSLHLTDYPLPSHKAMEQNISCDLQQTICSSNELEKEDRKSLSHTSVFKQTSDSPYPQTVYLTKQGRRKLRVGLSKSTRVKPLHPYWSKERIR